MNPNKPDADKSAEEILSCPLCGNQPELILRGNEYSKKRSAEIKCHNCNLEIIVGAIHNSLEWAENKVKEKWNTRQSSQSGKERAALEKLMDCYEKDKHLLNFDVNIARQALSTDVGEQDEKVPRLIKWANDGFPPIDLSNEFDAIMELIRAYQSLTRK